MKWLEEILKDVDNKEDVIAAVKKALGENYVPRDEFNTKNNEVKELTNQISDRDKQLTELKSAVGDNQELKDKIVELEESNKTIAADYETKVKEITLNNAIKLALNGKVHDEDITSSLIKQEELVISEDGKIVGLDEQVNNLKESKPFLFIEENANNGEEQNGFEKIGHDHKGGQGNKGQDQISAAFGNVKE